MNRRIFVKLGLLSAGAATLPFLNCQTPGNISQTIYLPSFLSQICEEKAIKEIGMAYQKINPDAKKQNAILKNLLTDTSGKSIPKNLDESELEKMLDEKIRSDFKNGNIVIVNGWVLSQTEAQQCSLFTLIPQ